jgi:hypothetical protein
MVCDDCHIQSLCLVEVQKCCDCLYEDSCGWPDTSSKPVQQESCKDSSVEQPKYYTRKDIPSGIECWDHYELAMTPEEFRGAMKNNIYKYIFRAGHKEDLIKDLEKALVYLKRWLRYENGERIMWMRQGQKNEKVR